MTKLNNKIINEIKALKLKMMNTTNLLATFESYGFILNDIDIDSSLVIFKHKFDYEIILKLLLKLNARKINLYDFIVLLKVLINKDFTYFLPAIMRFEGI